MRSIKGVESNVDYKVNDNWSMQAAFSYNDAHLTSSPYATFQSRTSASACLTSPYFSWSANVRYETPSSGAMRGYAQFDIGHKGDMWNDLHVGGVQRLPAHAAAGILDHERALRAEPGGRSLAGGAVL